MRQPLSPPYIAVPRTGDPAAMVLGIEHLEPGQLESSTAATQDFEDGNEQSTAAPMTGFLRPGEACLVYAQAVVDEVGTDQVAVRLMGFASADPTTGVVTVSASPDIVLVDPGLLTHTLALTAVAANAITGGNLPGFIVQAVQANANACRWAAAGWIVPLSAPAP